MSERQLSPEELEEAERLIIDYLRSEGMIHEDFVSTDGFRSALMRACAVTSESPAKYKYMLFRDIKICENASFQLFIAYHRHMPHLRESAQPRLERALTFPQSAQIHKHPLPKVLTPTALDYAVSLNSEMVWDCLWHLFNSLFGKFLDLVKNLPPDLSAYDEED